MKPLRRRLSKPTLGIMIATSLAQALPVGSIIDIVVDPPEGARRVDVLWAGQAMTMFVQDLHERSDIVNAAGAQS